MIYFIAILSFLFSSDIISDIHSYDLDESIDSEDTTYEEFPTLKYAFCSLLVPGSGQYGLSKIISQDDYKKKKSKQ